MLSAYATSFQPTTLTLLYTHERSTAALPPSVCFHRGGGWDPPDPLAEHQ